MAVEKQISRRKSDNRSGVIHSDAESPVSLGARFIVVCKNDVPPPNLKSAEPEDFGEMRWLAALFPVVSHAPQKDQKRFLAAQ